MSPEDPERQTALEEELRELLSNLCGRSVEGVDAGADLPGELGLDSLAGLRWLAAVEKRYGVRFPDERLEEFRTLARVREFIELQTGSRS